MSVVVEDRQGKRQIITKGAVEEMLDICSHAEFNGEVHPMTIELKNKARDIIEQMNKQGMRVIAVAHKSYLDKTCDFRIEGRERYGTDWVSGFPGSSQAIGSQRHQAIA